MFQFTTTNVINSDKDLTTGKELWKHEAESGQKPAVLRIKRVANFVKPNVMAIYKAVAEAAEMAKASIDFALVAGSAGDIFRLNIHIGLSEASQDSRYANDFKFKGKPFCIEFEWKDTATNTVKELVKTINNYEMLVCGEKLLNVTYNTSFLVIEATSEFLKFGKLDIEKFDKDANHFMGEFKVVRGIANLGAAKTANSQVTNDAEGFFPGKEGFGTYSYLMRNLRLPTSMRTRAFGVNQDETPVAGATYNQYTIHYCADRGVLGMNAVGDTVKSVTTHVFYVKSDLASAFETALGAIGTLQEVGPGKEKTPIPLNVHNEVSVNKNQMDTKLNGASLEKNASNLKVKG